MRRVMWGTCALGVMVALGCTDGEDVLLGRAQGAADDASSTDSSGDAGSPFTPPDDDALEVRRCEAMSEGELELLVDIKGVDEPSCAGGCSIQPHTVRAAADGSAWVSADIGSSGQRERLWLGHYDANGALLGAAIVANNDSPGYLAIDDRGNAWLLTGTFEAGYTRLHRFDATVHEIEAQVLAGGYTDLVTYPGIGVLLSNGSRPRVITALNYDGEQLWSRTDSARRIGRIAVDPEGNIVVGSPIPTGEGIRASSNLVLDWLGEPLDELRDTSNPLIRIDALDVWNFMEMSFDAQGRLTLVHGEQMPREAGSYVPQTNVERLDREHRTLWRWQVGSLLDATATIDMATGSTLVVARAVDARQRDQPTSYALALVAIAPDGHSCRRFTAEGPDLFGDIDSGPDGEIWFAGIKVEAARTVATIGRWARPDL